MKDLYTENYKTDKMKLKKTQGNGKISCVHGLEKLILLKCPLHIKSSIDLMQFLSKFFGRTKLEVLYLLIYNYTTKL